MLEKMLNKIFAREDIGRHEDSKSIYLRRWTIIRTSPTFWLWKLLRISDIRVYLHKFMTSDCSDALHSHPCSFVSFGFYNGYEEEFYDNKMLCNKKRTFKAPFIRYSPKNLVHRVTLLHNKPAWTLVFMMPKTQEWGFFVKENGKRKFIHWRKYKGEGCEQNNKNKM